MRFKEKSLFHVYKPGLILKSRQRGSKLCTKNFKPLFKTELLKYAKNISAENWSYCSTKVNPSDLITRLDKNIDFSKNSLWWRGPCFLFDKNQSYTKSNHCENKETLPDSFTGDLKEK